MTKRRHLPKPQRKPKAKTKPAVAKKVAKTSNRRSSPPKKKKKTATKKAQRKPEQASPPTDTSSSSLAKEEKGSYDYDMRYRGDAVRDIADASVVAETELKYERAPTKNQTGKLVIGSSPESKSKADAVRGFMEKALLQARKCLSDESLPPIGAVLVSSDGKVLATGHSKYSLTDKTLRHPAHMCLSSESSFKSKKISQATLYLTFPPCPNCIPLLQGFKIHKVVVPYSTANRLYPNDHAFMKRIKGSGIDLAFVAMPECRRLFYTYLNRFSDKCGPYEFLTSTTEIDDNVEVEEELGSAPAQPKTKHDADAPPTEPAATTDALADLALPHLSLDFNLLAKEVAGAESSSQVELSLNRARTHLLELKGKGCPVLKPFQQFLTALHVELHSKGHIGLLRTFELNSTLAKGIASLCRLPNQPLKVRVAEMEKGKGGYFRCIRHSEANFGYFRIEKPRSEGRGLFPEADCPYFPELTVVE